LYLPIEFDIEGTSLVLTIYSLLDFESDKFKTALSVSPEETRDSWAYSWQQDSKITCFLAKKKSIPLHWISDLPPELQITLNKENTTENYREHFSWSGEDRRNRERGRVKRQKFDPYEAQPYAWKESSESRILVVEMHYHLHFPGGWWFGRGIWVTLQRIPSQRINIWIINQHLAGCNQILRRKKGENFIFILKNSKS